MRTTPASWHACVQAVKQIPSDETAPFSTSAAASYNRRMAVVISGDEGIRAHKRWTVVSWIAGAVSVGMMAIQVYSMARVSIGPAGVRHFQWSENSLTARRVAALLLSVSWFLADGAPKGGG